MERILLEEVSCPSWEDLITQPGRVVFRAVCTCVAGLMCFGRSKQSLHALCILPSVKERSLPCFAVATQPTVVHYGLRVRLDSRWREMLSNVRVACAVGRTNVSASDTAILAACSVSKLRALGVENPC
eukprot:208276-Pleurochrysis_carterae.AAC.15